jgi:signal transduction histidine kinase
MKFLYTQIHKECLKLAFGNEHLPIRERRCIEEIAAVGKVARRINASLNLQETLDTIVDVVAELIPCSLVEIDLWDDVQQVLVLQAIRSTPERSYPVGQSFPPGRGYTGWVVDNRQPLLVSDVDSYLDLRPDILPGELPFKAYLGFPLLESDKLIGALVLVHDQAGVFNENDFRLLDILASQASIAIHNARIYDELGRHIRKLSALNAIAGVINQTLSLHEIMDQAIKTVIDVMETEAGGIRLLDQKTGELPIVASCGLSAALIKSTSSRHLGEGIVGDVAKSGTPQIIKDVRNDPRVLSSSEMVKERFKTFLVVPLRAKEVIVGTLGVVTRRYRDFTPDDVELLTTIGDQIGIAIENARLQREILQEERMAAIGRVATGVAHDLRSPLGGILRSVEFLSRSEISAETRDRLCNAVVSLAQRLINTSQGILDYVHGEKLSLKLTPCCLSDFLDEVLTVMEADFSDRGVEVERDFRYKEDLIIDADRMAQVVYNLAANARDAMPSGGKFRISTQKINNNIVIRFSDTGPGVPKELSKRIFEPYFSYGKGHGAGLGLAIARRIVEEHGGTIKLVSKAKQGANFVIKLPA